MAPVRQEKGSQAVFAAFVLDFRDSRRDLTLYQVGDVFSWVFGRENGRQGEQADPNGRWASRGQSDLRLRVTTLRDVAGLVIHSDGLRRDWVEALAGPCVSEEAFQAEVEERAKVDDLSFIALEIRRSLPAGQEKARVVGAGAPPSRVTLRHPAPGAAAHANSVAPPPRTARRASFQRVSRRTDARERSVRVSTIGRYWRMHRRPLLGSFMAGLVTGVSGLLLLYLWFFRAPAATPAVKPEASSQKAGPVTPTAPVSAPAPAPSRKPEPPVPALKALAVNARRVSQREFQERYAAFPATRESQVGEIIAHVTIDAVEATDLEVTAQPGETVQKEKCGTGKGCFLAYLTGPAPRKEVVFEAVDGMGTVLGRGQASLLGRQRREGAKRPFLGYYEIQLAPKKENSGDP